MPEFAPRDQTASREVLLDEFISRVLGLPWAFVSDGSTLADFEGVRPQPELRQACADMYGMALEPRHYEMPLYQLLDELEASRKST